MPRLPCYRSSWIPRLTLTSIKPNTLGNTSASTLKKKKGEEEQEEEEYVYWPSNLTKHTKVIKRTVCSQRQSSSSVAIANHVSCLEVILGCMHFLRSADSGNLAIDRECFFYVVHGQGISPVNTEVTSPILAITGSGKSRVHRFTCVTPSTEGR